MKASQHIILFDGVCNLCNGVVQYVIQRDQQGLFRFASLQSERGAALLSQSGLPADQLKSIVYIQGDQHYTKSSAALKVAAQLPFPTKLLSVLMIVPRFIRDFVYDLIARNRYKIFGKKQTCMVPLPQWEERFLT